MDISKLEEKILDRELDQIKEKLQKIGGDLIKVFEPYGRISGECRLEFAQYIVESIVKADATYDAGYTTWAKIDSNVRVTMPEPLKKIILDYAVRKFMERLEYVKSIAHDES